MSEAGGLAMDSSIGRERAAYAADAPASIELEISGVTKVFAGRAVIDNVSFRARGGELVALLGPSGAGKTTLLRCLAGLAAPDRGEIRLDGVPLAAMSRREKRRIAVIFQQFNLVGRLSALDNVLAGRLGYVPAWRGILRRFAHADRGLALECLQRVGLLAHAQQRADTLSGGQQQRVAIARALAQRPEIIIADEPIASLDPSSGEGILDLLRTICHAGADAVRAAGGSAGAPSVAVICSLHQMHLAKRCADRIVGLTNGRIAADGPAAAFDESMAAKLYGPDPQHAVAQEN